MSSERTDSIADPWTAALTCTICGEPISTEKPPEFPWERRIPGSVLWQKYQVHLQKYHPNYFALNIKAFFAAALLALLGVFAEAIVFPFRSSVLQVLPFAVALLVGLPLLRWYRRRVADVRSKWNPGHESVSASPAEFWKTPRYRWQMNKCHICGEEVPLRNGLTEDMQEHRKTRHPEYYLWTRRAYWVIPPLVVLFSIQTVGLVLRLRILSSVGLVGLMALLVIVIALGIWGERKYSRLNPAQLNEDE